MAAHSTKDRIFYESARLFAEHSYACVSLRDIAAAAEIKAPSIYHYYSSKAEILDALLTQYAASIRRAEEKSDTPNWILNLPPDEKAILIYMTKIVIEEQFTNTKARGLAQSGAIFRRLNSFVTYFNQKIAQSDTKADDLRRYRDIMSHMSITFAIDYIRAADETRAEQMQNMTELSEFIIELAEADSE